MEEELRTGIGLALHSDLSDGPSSVVADADFVVLGLSDLVGDLLDDPRKVEREESTESVAGDGHVSEEGVGGLSNGSLGVLFEKKERTESQKSALPFRRERRARRKARSR